MPRVRLSWAAAFLAAVLIHAVVLAALSWKSDSEETESAASGGSAISVALSAGGSGDSATMVAPVSTASVAAAESTPSSSDTQVLPPPPDAARSVDPEASASQPPGESETVPARSAQPAAATGNDSTVEALEPREVAPAAAIDRTVLLPLTEPTASSPETVFATAANGVTPTPPKDAEPVPAPRARTAATTPNVSIVGVLTPRQVASELADERESPLELMDTGVVPPTPAAPTAAGSTAQATDAPAAVKTVPAPPVSIAETPSETSVANSVAPREVQAAEAPDRGVLPATREIAATPPPPALPGNINVATSTPRSPRDVEKVTARTAGAATSSAATEGGPPAIPVTPREVDVASVADRAVLLQSETITVTVGAAASVQTAALVAQVPGPPTTVETVRVPTSPTATAEPNGLGAKAMPPRDVTPATAVVRADVPAPNVEVASVSSEPVIAQEAAVTQTVPVGPPATTAVQVAPVSTAVVAVPPAARAEVDVASTAAVEIETAVPRPVERPPRSDVASVVPPSEQGARVQEPTTTAPGARQSQKQEPRADAEASANVVEGPRSPGESRQTAAGGTGVEAPTGSRGAGEAGTEEESLAIDLTGDGRVPDRWSEYLSRLQTWLRQHKEYPRRARFRRQEGTTFLRFVIDRDGRLRDYGIEKSSGHELLDRAVIDMIERSRPLPPIPSHLERSSLALTVPVQFVLR